MKKKWQNIGLAMIFVFGFLLALGMFYSYRSQMIIYDLNVKNQMINEFVDEVREIRLEREFLINEMNLMLDSIDLLKDE